MDDDLHFFLTTTKQYILLTETLEKFKGYNYFSSPRHNNTSLTYTVQNAWE